MSKFNTGDRVLVNRAQIATIQTYDEANNLVTYVVKQGGGENITTSHISHTEIVPLQGELLEVADIEGPAVHDGRDPVTNTKDETVDLMGALKASVEAAKASRQKDDE